MYRRAYLLTFDRDDNRDYKSIHDGVIGLPSVITWWHYLKSSYILIADTNSASILSAEIQLVFKKKRFLLVEINLKNKNGMLPKDAWEWLKNQATKTF